LCPRTQRDKALREITDIGRYSYRVIILANLDDWSPEKLRKLTGGFPVSICDHEHAYEKLVFPVVAGTYFNASDLVIYVELSNKNAGSKISYTVQTKHHECEITVLFVPIAEVARLMGRYKNSILKYNPRSYLELYGATVNSAIRETILSTTGNEFALLNNGITILSDETSINERIGQRNKAQLHLRNPRSSMVGRPPTRSAPSMMNASLTQP
jgi:hypothetical protein